MAANAKVSEWTQTGLGVKPHQCLWCQEYQGQNKIDEAEVSKRQGMKDNSQVQQQPTKKQRSTQWITYNHRIIESLESEGTFKGHVVQLPTNEEGHHSYIRLPRAWSSLTLKVSRDGASTTSVGNLFQLVKPSIKGVQKMLLTAGNVDGEPQISVSPLVQMCFLSMEQAKGI